MTTNADSTTGRRLEQNPEALWIPLVDWDELCQKLNRARWIAAHLFEMVSEEDWKNSGGDDGQGHYEGLYHAEKLQTEIQSWGELNNADQR